MTAPAPPRHYVVRKPTGDPAAARQLAHAYDDLADTVRDEVRRVAAVLDQLAAVWQGSGAHASDSPARVIGADGARVASALSRSADDLRHYAHRLAKAHEHHGWSLGKLVALGAMVTVGAAAVVVTVGAAAPAETAAAAAAVDSAEAAATAASAAGTAVTVDLAAWQTALAGLRPLAPFVVPHLISAAGGVILEAGSELLTAHHLDLRALEVASAAGFAGSGVGAAVEERLLAARPVVRRLAESGTWAATGSTAAYADAGHVDPLDSLAVGMTGFVGRDIRRFTDATWAMWRRWVGADSP